MYTIILLAFGTIHVLSCLLTVDNVKAKWIKPPLISDGNSIDMNRRSMDLDVVGPAGAGAGIRDYKSQAMTPHTHGRLPTPSREEW